MFTVVYGPADCERFVAYALAREKRWLEENRPFYMVKGMRGWYIKVLAKTV